MERVGNNRRGNDCMSKGRKMRWRYRRSVSRRVRREDVKGKTRGLQWNMSIMRTSNGFREGSETVGKVKR